MHDWLSVVGMVSLLGIGASGCSPSQVRLDDAGEATGAVSEQHLMRATHSTAATAAPGGMLKTPFRAIRDDLSLDDRRALPPGGEPSLDDGAPMASTIPLTYPVRAALGSDGILYISDAGAGAVLGCRADQIVYERRGLSRPLGLAVVGERLLVGEAGRARVAAFSTLDGEFLFAFGSGDGEVGMPNAIAASPDGTRIFVADSPAHRILVYDGDGRAQGSFGEAGGEDGALRFPAAVAANAQRVAVADQANHRVQVYDHAGNWQLSFGSLPPQGGQSLDAQRGRLVRPQGVAWVDDQIAVLDSVSGTVQLFTADGAAVGFVGGRGSCSSCVDLALDLLWDPVAERFVVTDPNHRRVVWLALAWRGHP